MDPTADELSGATAQFAEFLKAHPDWGLPEDGVHTYQKFRSQGQDHATALASAFTALGWVNAAPAPGPGPATPNPTPGPAAPTTPTGLSYADVLAKAQSYYQQKWGVALSPAVIAQIKADLGFQEGGRVAESALTGLQSWIDGHKPASGPTTGPGGPGGFGGTPDPYHSDPNAPGYTPLGRYDAPVWTGGDYVNPTQADLEASPGYAARLNEGLKARERSAAAQGTVLNGGTLKALDRFSQDYASNEYQTLRNNTYEAYKQRYSQFQDAAGMDLAARTVNANDNNTTYANRTAAYTSGNARTLSDYLTNVTTKRNAELDYWNRLMDVTKNGTTAANGSYKTP